jgi:hypothetical protein
MIQLSPPSPGGSSFGGGQPYGTATGRTASFGYGSLSGGGVKPMRGTMQPGPKLEAAPFQGTPSEPIGIQAPPAQAAPEKSGGGGGGLISRGMSVLKGIGEGGGAAEGAAGGAGAAEGAGVLEEAAPLLLAAA